MTVFEYMWIRSDWACPPSMLPRTRSTQAVLEVVSDGGVLRCCAAVGCCCGCVVTG
jgi:hypothetical protein